MSMTETKENLLGPILALDLGQKRVGVAISDPLMISITKLSALNRSSWKQLLKDVAELARRFDARTLVIGLPLSLDGTWGSAASETQNVAVKFARSLEIPVYLQDEVLTSVEAEGQLRVAGLSSNEIRARVDSQAAAIILSDFIAGGGDRILVSWKSSLRGTAATPSQSRP